MSQPDQDKNIPCFKQQQQKTMSLLCQRFVALWLSTLLAKVHRLFLCFRTPQHDDRKHSWFLGAQNFKSENHLLKCEGRKTKCYLLSLRQLSTHGGIPYPEKSFSRNFLLWWCVETPLMRSQPFTYCDHIFWTENTVFLYHCFPSVSFMDSNCSVLLLARNKLILNIMFAFWSFLLAVKLCIARLLPL